MDDAWIQTVEVHNEDVLIPEPSFRLEDETTFIFVLRLALAFLPSCPATLGIKFFSFGLSSGTSISLAVFIGTNIFQSVEFVEKNVFISLSSTTGKRLAPKKNVRSHKCIRSS